MTPEKRAEAPFYPATCMVEVATVWAPINIAVLKYWGKENVPWNLPMNDSISVTLDGENERLGTETTVAMEPSKHWSFQIHINGVCYSDTVGKNGNRIFDALSGSVRGDLASNYSIKVESTNFSPTASGLASSASGYAALTMALAACLGMDCASEGGLSALSCVARLGSGSACRSLHGGFVHWCKAVEDEAGELSHEAIQSSSIAKQMTSEDWWPDLGCLIIRLDYPEKDLPSTKGMQRTVDTSDLSKLRYNTDYIEGKVTRFRHALMNRDFEAFAELVMRDSNQFHALCLDSYPPIIYLKPESWQVIERIHDLNTERRRLVAAYTFDAGPHPVVFYQRGDRDLLNGIYDGIKCTVIPCKVSKGAEVKTGTRT